MTTAKYRRYADFYPLTATYVTHDEMQLYLLNNNLRRTIIKNLYFPNVADLGFILFQKEKQCTFGKFVDLYDEIKIIKWHCSICTGKEIKCHRYNDGKCKEQHICNNGCLQKCYCIYASKRSDAITCKVNGIYRCTNLSSSYCRKPSCYEKHKILWEIKTELNDLGDTLRQIKNYVAILKTSNEEKILSILVYHKSRFSPLQLAEYFEKDNEVIIRIIRV